LHEVCFFNRSDAFLRWSLDALVSHSCIIISGKKDCVYGLDISTVSAYPSASIADLETLFMINLGEKIIKLLKGNLVLDSSELIEQKHYDDIDDPLIIYALSEFGTIYTIRSISRPKFRALGFLSERLSHNRNLSKNTSELKLNPSFQSCNSINITEVADYLHLDNLSRQTIFDELISGYGSSDLKIADPLDLDNLIHSI
jgi:hypothetical protein